MRRLIQRLTHAFSQMRSATAVRPDVFIDGGNSARKIVVLSEFINATYFISFDLPGRKSAEQGRSTTMAYSQATIEQIPLKSCGEFARQLRRVYQPDAVVFSRFRSEHGVRLVEEFRRERIPTVYHIDDDLLELPESLGKAVIGLHGSPSSVEWRQKMLSSVDLVYASTGPLAQRLSSRIPRQSFVHGIYAPYLEQIPPARGNRTADGIVFGYAGSRGHQVDLDALAPAIANVLDRNASARFEVFGTVQIPDLLKRFGERAICRQAVRDYCGFLAELTSLSWDFGLIPLEDTPFNRCRACTKYVEYSACGIPSIVSDMPVYNQVVNGRNGLLVGPNGWEAAIERLCANQQLRESLLKQARATCRDRFALSTLQGQVLEVVDQAIQNHASHDCAGQINQLNRSQLLHSAA